MQPPQTGDRQSGACFAFPTSPLSCCCCNYHTRVLGADGSAAERS